MFTKTRNLLILLFLIAFSTVDAQEQIERLFRGDRQNTGIDVVLTPDDGFLVLSAGRPLDSTRFEYYTVSKFDNKTNFLWSKDYDFEHKVFPDGSLTLLEGDSFLLSGVMDTTSINKVLMKGTPNGDVVWTKGFGRDDMNTPLLLGDAPVDVSSRGFFLAGDVYSPGFRNDIFLTETDSAGNQIWGKVYSENTTGFYTTKVKMTQDSGAIMVGSALTIPNSNISVVKTDSIGNIEWSRVYGEANLVEIGTAITPTPDGGYLIGGRKINPLLPSHPGLLIKTDTFGTPQWALNVDFQTSDTILINDIMMMSDGNALVSGSLLGAVDNFAYMMKIDMSGDIIWKRRYKASTRQSLLSNGLDEASNGGGIYLTSSDEDPDNTQAGFYLIKTDENGETICDSIVDGQLVFPTTVTIDTLVLTTNDVSDIRDITIVDTTNYTFNLTTLELETFGPYCPDEIFSDTLDATTDGAVAYEWSTGETTPTIVVSEFDEYKVTVTIGVDYCYTLCSETSINELPLPTIELSSNDDSFCSEGTVIISAATTATDMVDWSTTETGNSITVTTEGVVMATATNVCGTESASIDIVFDTSAPGPVTATEVGNFCDDGISTLESSADGYDSVIWTPTNETNETIFADQSGVDYSVTGISNFCDDLESDPIQVNTPAIDGDIETDGLFCSTGQEILTLTPTREPLNNIIWENDNMQTNLTFVVTDPSITSYSVTFSDFCDEATVIFDEIARPEITGEISSDGLYCATGEEVLTLTTSTEAVNGIVWNNDNTETDETFTATALGTYTATFSDFCDEGTAELELTPSEFTVSISGDDSFCEDGDEVLSPMFEPVTTTPTSYTWLNETTVIANTPSATIQERGNYSLVVSDFCDSDTASIVILCGFKFDAPNAFTPNNDNVSDLFIPVFTADVTDFVEYKFEVYSRWGSKVFETDDPLEGWDGTINEEAAVPDVYFYKVEGVNIFGEPLTREAREGEEEILDTKQNHGDITLIR